MKSKEYSQVKALLEELRSGTQAFFENEQNQTESTILEYKASFGYDTALGLCPHTAKNKKTLVNGALELKILETIVAFANTNGGLLVLGVAERKGQIVDKYQKSQCEQVDSQVPCFLEVESLPSCDIKNLRIFGINQELELRGNDLDQFQRMIFQRFSLNKGKKHSRESIPFHDANYPCDGGRTKIHTSVSPSISPDTLIEGIFHFNYMSGENIYRLCAILVEPAVEPVMLNMNEEGSQTLKTVFPFRRTGENCLVEDFQTILEHIQKRFRPSLAEDVYERIVKLFPAMPSADKQHLGDNLLETVSCYAKEWVMSGYSYYHVEVYGKSLKEFTLLDGRLDVIHDNNELAFILIVSIHYNAGWERWTRKNTSNGIAIAAMLQVLTGVYWRTRFRVLYALQFVDQAIISSLLAEERFNGLSENTRDALQLHVPNKTVVDFLKRVANNSQKPVCDKASEVLSEIASRWKDVAVENDVPL